MPKTPAKKAAKPAPQKSATLDSLDKPLSKAEKALASSIFKRVSEGALLEIGTSVDSTSLIDDVPEFASATIEIEKNLTPTQRPLLKLPGGIVALIVAETIALRSLRDELAVASVDNAGDKARRDAAARQEVREGIATRDIVYDALRNILGRDGMAGVDAVVGTAETPEALANGLTGLAKLIRQLRKENSDEVALFDAFEIHEACAVSLEEKAARVRQAGVATASSPKKVTQRRLDIQDGRVAHLLGIVLRAFRAARRADSSILVPALRASAWLFDTRSGKPKAQNEPAAPEPKADA